MDLEAALESARQVRAQVQDSGGKAHVVLDLRDASGHRLLRQRCTAVLVTHGDEAEVVYVVEGRAAPAKDEAVVAAEDLFEAGRARVAKGLTRSEREARDAEVRELAEAGCSDREIAARLGVSTASVRRMRRRKA